MEHSPTVIPPHARIDGLIETSADLVVEGCVQGKVEVGGTLTVAAGATCRASARARVVAIHGEVIGNVVGTESITVAAGARVVGDLRAPEVSVHAAGEVDGKVDLLAPAPESAPIRRTLLASRGRGPRRPVAPPPSASTAASDRVDAEVRPGEPVAAVAAEVDADASAVPRAIPKPRRPSGRVRVTQRPGGGQAGPR